MDEIVETYRLIPTEGEGLLRNSHLEMLYATVRHFNGGISLKEQYGKDALIEIEEYRKELVEADIADIRDNFQTTKRQIELLYSKNGVNLV